MMRLIAISSGKIGGIIGYRPTPRQAPAVNWETRMTAHDALRPISQIAGWTNERARTVEITGGDDPVLPTPFRIGAASAAALAATGLAAADLWELRTRRRQQVAVDLRQAVASLRSGHYLQVNGAKVRNERNPVMGMYPAKNGRWSYIHANFPNHRAAALRVLGCEENREAVKRAVANWDALELEEAIIAAGGAGGMVRSMAEWAQHPQAAAIASLPLLEIVKIGDSPPEPLPDGDRPLSGIRVLDLTRVLAGPTCARTLAEHGADVLKITAPHIAARDDQEYDTGHGKLSARLDLRQPQDLDTLKALVREGDVFSQGYRPGTLADRGLSPEELARLRPGLVYVSLCAFSHKGPWAARRGFDTVVQNVSGITTRQGELFPGPEPGPQFYPVSAIDYLTGYLMAFGAMVALARRAREGGSWLVRISLAQTGRWLVGLGEVPESALRDVPKEFSQVDLDRWSIESDTPAGRLRHLGPTIRLSETALYWARPSVPLGYNQPVWPARAA
jgi:crotonobetainyl-CoA:carnitine CoA-transferase CaiB-like acyl-CoA transferase